MITKRPKRVDVRWVQFFYERSVYVCPACKTTFEGAVQRNSTRFKCDCGQELIVEQSTENEDDQGHK